MNSYINIIGDKPTEEARLDLVNSLHIILFYEFEPKPSPATINNMKAGLNYAEWEYGITPNWINQPHKEVDKLVEKTQASWEEHHI